MDDALLNESAALDAEVRYSDLPSGVRLGTDPMAHTRSVSIACFVGVGSRDESAELAGASHFLEHLLFKGTIRRSSREINRAIDAVGGDFNAYTVRESTVFYVRVPVSHADFATDLLCEVIATPRFDPADVEIERGVILGELDGALDSPDDVVFMNLAEALFPGHPLGRETLGDVESLGRMTTPQIAAFHDRWYRPANLVFAAAGAVDHDGIAAIIERHWADAPRGDRPVRVAPMAPTTSEVSDTRDIEQVHLALGWRGVTSTDPDRVPLSVLNHALGDGPSSRLHEEVREHRGLAYAVSSSASGNIDAGSQTVYCATAPEHLAEVSRVIDETVAAIVSDGIDDDELAVAKGYLTGSMMMAFEDSSSRMSRLGSAISNHGRTIPISESLAAVDAVTHDDVRRVARNVFGGERVTSVVGPADE
ncbi:MAG: pitrilysin family protein [Acidimicrobiales bacterium]